MAIPQSSGAWVRMPIWIERPGSIRFSRAARPTKVP
jgi:hypothetical protein